MSTPSYPYVPIRRSGWSARRTPFLAYVAGAVLIAGVVLVALVHRPSTAERASDLRGFVGDMRADVGASLSALRAIETGASQDVATARTIATSGASDCSPANDELIDDLLQYQVTESLANYHLTRVVNGLVAWAAPDAIQVQSDVGRVLSARGPRARAGAQAALRRAEQTLNAQRAGVDAAILSASRSLSAGASPPPLPG